MDDRSWMYWDLPQGLRRMDYCNGVQGFINSQHLSRGILLMAVLGIHAGSAKIKKFMHQDVVTMHLQTKGFMEDYLCWYAHGELFVPNESIVKRVVGQLLVLITCMKLEMTTVILTGIWL